MTEKQPLVFVWAKVGDSELAQLSTDEQPVYVYQVLEALGVEPSQASSVSQAKYFSGRIRVDMNAGTRMLDFYPPDREAAPKDLPEDVWPQVKSILVGQLGFSEEAVDDLRDEEETWKFG